MSTEFSENNKHQPESALAGISENILAGLTYPVELFTGKSKEKELDAFRESAKDYLKEGLKTTAMFMRGKSGLIGTVVTQALDEWKPADKKHAALDLALGTAKGAALTYVFRKTAMVDPDIKFFGSALNVPLNAAKLGLFSRIPSVGLSRSTWVDENDKFNAQRTGNILLASTASIGTDIVAGVATHGLLKGTNKLTDNAVAKSPMLSTMLTGSGFGMSNGATQETFRQTDELGEFNPLKLNYWKIGQSALLQGAIDTVAAIPGGHQAEREALRIYNSMNTGATKATKVPSFKRNTEESSESQNYGESGDNCYMCLNEREIKSTTIEKALNQSTGETFSRFDKQIESKRFNVIFDQGKNKIVQRLQDFVVYIPKDHNLIIGVPAEYNRKLEDVRQERLRLEAEGRSKNEPDLLATLLGTNDHALPEDLIPCLDALPNSHLVKSIYLHNEANPYDIKSGIIKALASAHRPGHLNYYKHPPQELFLRFTTNHEYGHLVEFQFADASRAYHCACALENALKDTTVNARDYATKNMRENFAVHFGEELLEAAPQYFIKATEYAPLRMAVLAKALKSTLTDIPQAKVSLHREQYLKRAELLEEKFIPQIVDGLIRVLTKEPDKLDNRLLLLAYLGRPKDAQKLLKLAGTASNQETAGLLLGLGYEMCQGNRNKQLDFLLRMSEITPFDEVRCESIRQFSGTEIETHLLPYVARLPKSSKSHYLKAFNDIASWHQANGNTDVQEIYSRMVVEQSKDNPSPETLTATDSLIDCLMNRQSYKEAEQYMHKSIQTSKKLYGETSPTNRENISRLADFLFTEGRYEEALPLVVRQFQIDKALSKKGELADRIFYLNEMNYDLKNLIEINEILGNEKGQVHWLRKFNDHLNGQIQPDVHLEVIDKLMSLLTIRDGKEIENLWKKQKYLHTLKENLGILEDTNVF